MNASVVGGPMNIDGPMTVHGSLTVGGPATVHGAVGAQKLVVGGPVETTFPHGERPGPAGQAIAGDLVIGGPLTVNGPLLVEGTLKIGGPLKTEMSANNETYPVIE
jgi:cytoskeletal protein CcmA (bactofilin family)